MRRARLAAVAVLVGLATGGSAAAQAVPRERAVPAPPPGWLTSAFFHLAIESLLPPADAFAWNTELGGDVDLLDFGAGRINVLVHYEALLGDQLQRFDPNQSLYTLQAMGTVRRGDAEVGAFLHHVSRHLGDRAKNFQINWNDVGAQYAWRGEREGWLVEATGRASWVVTRQLVDYRALADGELRASHAVHPRVSVVGRAVLARVFTTGSGARGDQIGYRGELGVRLRGSRASTELFVGGEQRVDAAPLDPGPRRWLLLGWRLTSP